MGRIGSSFLDELSFVLGWATRPALALVHLTMTRRPETNGKTWNIYIYEYIGFEKYFIIFQMNFSIQVELLVEFLHLSQWDDLEVHF